MNRNPTTKFAALVIMAMFTVASDGAVENATSSPRQLLRAASAAMNWTKHSHTESTLRFTFTTRGDNGRLGKPGGTTAKYDLFQDGDRLRMVQQNASEHGYAGAHVVLLITPQRRIAWVKNDYVLYTKSNEVIKQSAGLDRAYAGYGWFLNGVLSDRGGAPVFDFAAAARLGNISPVVHEGKIGGLSCKIVDVSTDSWKLRVWIAPSRGYNFAKFTFSTASAGHQEDIIVDDVSYKHLRGSKWVIQSARYRQHYSVGGHVEQSKEITAKRTLIDLAPDFAKLGAFNLPPIPNGQEVGIQVADKNGKTKPSSGLKYMWENGKVVRAYDPKIVNQIRQLEAKSKQEETK